ncbi:MAG: hypothetical protein JW882_11390 [Deltaproteobacteria bacterium]|nr:hypothetical protein [Deltaproteobacteria bacterium]
MKRDNKAKIIFLPLLIVFLCIWSNGLVFAYGGGGGGGSYDQPKASETARKYTREELQAIFSGLPEDIREMIIDKQEGKTRTPAQLNLIKSIFLSAENWKHQSEEAIWQSYEEVAVVLDQAGQNAEIVLAFTTGGTSTFVTGTLFGATRAGVSEYSKGKGVEDILQAMAVSVAVDKIMGNVQGLKNMSTRGERLVDMVARAAQLNQNPKVRQYLMKVGTKAGVYKSGEKLTKDTIAAILNAMATQVRKASVPTMSPPMTTYMGPGEFVVTPMGQTLYK